MSPAPVAKHLAGRAGYASYLAERERAQTAVVGLNLPVRDLTNHTPNLHEDLAVPYASGDLKHAGLPAKPFENRYLRLVRSSHQSHAVEDIEPETASRKHGGENGESHNVSMTIDAGDAAGSVLMR